MTEAKLVPIDKIQRFEDMLFKLPQVPLQTTHEFCDGIYARTLCIPAGVVLTGAIHRSENFLLVRSGDITVWTEEGMKRAQAGAMVKSLPGAKRVGYAHSDTLLTTFHPNPTNETDPEELWELFTVDDISQIENEVILQIED
jgi:hypothetical protein